MGRKKSQLKRFLDRLLDQRDPAEYRSDDPVEIVWSYDRDADREVVALVASCLAYGRVELLKEAIRRALAPLGSRPARRLADPAFPGSDALESFRYRMTGGIDLADLYAAIGSLLREYGTLEAAYRAGSRENHLEGASQLVRRLRAARKRERLHRGFRYLLPDPLDGSACKRLHLFFRWVGRGPDGVDLGLWDGLDPSDLLMPLDTHTSRICRYLGLTDRKTVDGTMAREVTSALKQLDADDPVKYDFALCHLGISDACIHERSLDHCPTCPIEPVCRL